MKFINLKTRTEENAILFPSVLCVGNFDGVHIGHRQLVEEVRKQVPALKKAYPNIVSGAWFFDSTSYKHAPEIYTLDEKLDAFESLGLDYAVIADFDEMKYMSPEEFVAQILRKECQCVFAVCGENFRFGSKAAGSASDLARLMQGNADIVTLLTDEEKIVSSTYIRELLSNGDIENANRLLDSRYSLTAPIVHGKALGRTLGLPTINQFSEDKNLILKSGIYCTVCTIDGKKFYGVTNVGIRPTVNDSEIKNIETHIIDYSGDCYGKLVKVEFVSRLRDEIKFTSLDELKSQILSDINNTKKYFKI